MKVGGDWRRQRHIASFEALSETLRGHFQPHQPCLHPPLRKWISFAVFPSVFPGLTGTKARNPSSSHPAQPTSASSTPTSDSGPSASYSPAVVWSQSLWV